MLLRCIGGVRGKVKRFTLSLTLPLKGEGIGFFAGVGVTMGRWLAMRGESASFRGLGVGRQH
ncbi:MAG: hypothetical protein WBC82_00275 [Dehalococcoidia bacterium]